MSKDLLGQRMKSQYENRTRYFLPRRTYTIIRLDGKAFHTFTRGMQKPFDAEFAKMMDETAKFLCRAIQGAKFAYVQSDEISILLTDFEKVITDAWFDGNVQKMVSVSASLATGKFNAIIAKNLVRFEEGLEYIESADWCAFFDSRVFTIPDPIEVENYFVWRQKDAVRNSIAMTAQSLYSHKELNGKSQSDMQEMIFQKGQNWNDMPEGFKRGRTIVNFKSGDEAVKGGPVGWTTTALDFSKNREELRMIIPKYETT